MSLITIDIVDVAFGGDGVGRKDGKVVFVPGVLPGETVEVKIISTSKKFSRALPVKVVKASTDRQVSDCPYSLHESADISPSKFCPGCSYRHVSYEAEVAIKEKQLGDLLSRMAKLDNLPKITANSAPSPSRYRNKITMHCTEDKTVGYVSADNTTVVDVSDCMLACKEISESIRNTPADMLLPDSRITHRYTEKDGVKCWSGPLPGGPPLTDSSSLGPMLTPPSSFAQVNPEVSALLTNAVKDLLSNLKPENMIDLYCGTGLFAIAAAAAGVPSVFGVEKDQAAVDCAALNAKEIAPGHANFICADANDGLKTVLNSGIDIRETVLLVDPPRQGIHKSLLHAISRLELKALIYISCAADKLARDTKMLRVSGYEMESAALFDMFPRTASFETLAVFKKRF